MKKIIVPVDFSDSSKNAANYAISLSSVVNAAVDLVHVFHPGPSTINGEVIIDPLSKEVKLEKLKRYASEVRSENKQDDLFLNYEIMQGFAADEIVALSSSMENSMIVMGSTGNSKLQKKIFGSVSTKVAKAASNPVLIIPPNTKYHDWKNILYCSNEPNLDTAVFNKLVEFAKISDAHIHLAHAKSESNPDYDEFNLLKMYQNFYPKEKISFSNIEGEDPVDCILSYSLDNDIDIIASATKDRGFLNDIFHKSFTKELSIKANLPILILHQ